MRIKRFIEVTFKIEGFHKYPNAPDEVAFLRDLHRHMFNFRIRMAVSHNERDLEFIMVKRALEKFMQTRIMMDANNSCETLAENLIHHIDKQYQVLEGEVEVNEDGENGAILKWVI